ncbi:class II fructose-bisphosphate aldolase [candidate division KSB1 bacterium]|nr:class II fructose-bisphosphate aldolase [candidate division KSB1 bacterium]
MSLQNMTSMLQRAQKNGYAVGAFNIVDYNSMRAVIDAAEELRAPVIVQTSVKTVLFWGYEAVMSWMTQLTQQAAIPVAIHVDHCTDIEVIKRCIDAGWTSVMIDASAKPFAENIRLTRQVLDMTASCGVSVEAELGAIVGVEDDIHVKAQEAHLADPDQAAQFCHELQLDCFAPAVGTAHGVYKGEPKIAYDLIKEIAARTGVPLALHGGTGLSDAVFRKCIGLGCAKVNISTQLKYAHIDGFVNYHQENKVYNPLKPLAAQYNALKAAVAENIKLFGGAGQA